MKRLITKDDFIDAYLKLQQRGHSFILSKLNLSGTTRTKSAFDESAAKSSNWWKIPEVKKRWNLKITGNKILEYEDYVLNKYFTGQSDLKMLSIGSGVCSHELKFASSAQFSRVICIDLVQNLLDKAKQKAKEENIGGISFIQGDIQKLTFDQNEFDVILFHSSLHHMYEIEQLLSEKIKAYLKPNGKLIINEYSGPNRLQYPTHQIEAINEALQLIPSNYRQRFQSSLKKKKYHGSGYLRMLIADPSECKESAYIKPVLRSHFQKLEEKPYGGNILMPVLKDISHNFVEQTEESRIILENLFEFEDAYLKSNESDFLFGVYQNDKINTLSKNKS